MPTTKRDRGWNPYPYRQIVNYFDSAGALACWNFDGSGSYLTDRTGNGYNLAWLSGGVSWRTEWSMMGIWFNNDRRLRAPNEEALRLALIDGGGGDASATVEWITGHYDTQASKRMFALSASGESLATNYLIDMNTTSTYNWSCFNEYNSGVNISPNFGTECSVLNPNVWVTHYKFPATHALTVSADGTTRKLYTNGLQNGATYVGLPAEKHGTTNSQRWHIGGNEGANSHYGMIMAFRITAAEKSASEIETVFQDELTEIVSFAKFFDMKAAIEDKLTPSTAGGPAKWSDTLSVEERGVGQRVPGAPNAAIAEINSMHNTTQNGGPWPAAGIEDGVAFPSGGGPPSWENDGEQSMGWLVPDPNQDARWPRDKYVQAGMEDDVSAVRQSSTPQFSDATSDDEGHPHWNAATNAVILAFKGHYYYTDEEPWANPTAHADFTGFARNGKRYTNGVEDAGPTWAPWATEGASNDRSSRVDFPSKALIIVTWEELTIMDCDNYDPLDHTTLRVWMRFRKTATTGNTMYIAGAGAQRGVKMINGSLVLANRDAGSGYYLEVIDFKLEGNYTTTLISTTINYNLITGFTIADRNTIDIWQSSGMTQAVHTYSENLYHCDAFPGEVADNELYAIGVGEDTGDGVFFYKNGVPQWHSIMQGPDRGSVNLYEEFYRRVLFDRQGWLWTTVNNRLFRHLDFYKDQAIRQEIGHRHQLSITLPHDIFQIVAAREHLYASTSVGIYKIDRVTLEYYLAYTVPGLGGQGRVDGYGIGAILKGEESQPYSLSILNLETASYLGVIMSYGGNEHAGRFQGLAGCTVIRLFDDQVMVGYTYPQLIDDGGYMVNMVPY